MSEKQIKNIKARLRKLGWVEDDDYWISPDTKIDYTLEQAGRLIQ